MICDTLCHCLMALSEYSGVARSRLMGCGNSRVVRDRPAAQFDTACLLTPSASAISARPTMSSISHITMCKAYMKGPHFRRPWWVTEMGVVPVWGVLRGGQGEG